MAININELYKFVQFVSNKEQSGYIKPSEFNIAVDRAQMQLFMERYNNPAEYQPGRPVPRVSYQQTQKVSDDLRPFIKKVYQPLTGDGKFVWSNLPDYMHLSSLRAQYYKVDNTNGESYLRTSRIKILDDSELSVYLDSSILQPTTEYPIAAIYNGYLQVYPTNIGGVDVTYLSRPNKPDDGQFWEFTVNVTTGMPDYNPATSTNLNWSNELFNEIGIRILSFCSVNLKDTTLTQYSELKKQQGI
tara:strand:- start:134 stop:868 length:735 start_codon:yes stop_codon:yes gene_type:complete